MAEPVDGVVMLLDSVFPAPGGGGSESQVRTLSLRLLALGVPVTVVVPATRPDEAAVDVVDGIPVRRIAYPRVRRLGALVLLLRFAWWLLRERARYGAIHAHVGGNMAAVAAVVGGWLGKSVVVKMAGDVEFAGGVTSAQPSAGARLRRLALRRAGCLQATSSRIAAALVAGGFDPARIEVLPNAVDLGRFAPAARDPALRRDLAGEAATFIAVYVGRLEPEKDPTMLVDAWAQAFGGDPSHVLLVVGHGSQSDMLRLRALRSGVGATVRFLGARDDVEHLVGAADVGVLPSRVEGLSNTLLEYMAAGLPALGTRVSGTEDFVVTGRNGWLVEPGDTDGLAAALRAAAALGGVDRAALGRQARATVAARASLDAVLARLRSLYARRPGEPLPAPARAARAPEV
jgi:glycosyltransferase involved in cell wall biosynthesis